MGGTEGDGGVRVETLGYEAGVLGSGRRDGVGGGRIQGGARSAAGRVKPRDQAGPSDGIIRRDNPA